MEWQVGERTGRANVVDAEMGKSKVAGGVESGEGLGICSRHGSRSAAEGRLGALANGQVIGGDPANGRHLLHDG